MFAGGLLAAIVCHLEVGMRLVGRIKLSWKLRKLHLLDILLPLMPVRSRRQAISKQERRNFCCLVACSFIHSCVVGSWQSKGIHSHQDDGRQKHLGEEQSDSTKRFPCVGMVGHSSNIPELELKWLEMMLLVFKSMRMFEVLTLFPYYIFFVSPFTPGRFVVKSPISFLEPLLLPSTNSWGIN